MKQFFKEPEAYLLMYVVAALFTFGHAYHQVPDTEDHQFAGVQYTVHNGPGTKVVGAALATMFWPLYWSVKAWEPKKELK